jgi:hypothetical protein
VSERTTSSLTIGSNPSGSSLGVLIVQVVASSDDQEPIEFVLTSQYRQHSLDVPLGKYTIVAERPNGDRLLRYVTVAKDNPATVNFDVTSESASTPFLYEETLRGEVGPKTPPSASPSMKAPSDMELESTEPSPTLHDRYAFTAHNRSDLKGFAGTSLKVIKRGTAAPPTSQKLTFRVWADGDTAVPQCEVGTDFIKIMVQNQCAVGLLDESGFGPIVINPGFAQGCAITFSAEGVASKAAARSANPSGLRTPVAVACPMGPVSADLLSALASPVVEHAGEVLRQNLNLQTLDAGAVHNALDALAGKFSMSAEALVAAHYLLRFRPELLPLSWALNLEWASPAADGPIIAAWLVLLSNASDVSAMSESDCNAHFHTHFTKALERPSVLFARTRLLLSRGLSMRPSDVQAQESQKVVPFFEFGAHAGGLEAFWGRGPMSPGPDGDADKSPYRDIAGVDLRDAEFQTFAKLL